MAISQNGYSVYFGASGLVSFKYITGRVRGGDTAVVLGYLADRFDSEVENIRQDWSWGWAVRAVRGKSSGYSNHASGTAVDFNAPKHPLGRSGTFTAGQRNKIHAILRDMDGVIRWGGDYSGRKDEMHFEVNVNAARLKAFANKVRNKTAPGLGGVAKPAWKPTNGPISIKLTNNRFADGYAGRKVARTSGVGLIQKALNSKANAGLVVDGYAGKATLAAYAAYERKLKGAGKSNVKTVDADVLRSLELKVKEDNKVEAKPVAPAKPKVTSHTRWTLQETGVYDKIDGKVIRTLPRGYSFGVIDGSGHGKDGWIETTYHNWVKGEYTSTTKPSEDKWTWNPAVVSDLPLVQEQFHITQGAVKGEVKRYHGIATIQAALNKNGEKLKVDGYAGKETVAAWKRWETKHPGTGWKQTPDMTSLTALGVGDKFREAGGSTDPKDDGATPGKPVSFVIATANAKELPRHDKTIANTFKTAVKGVHIVGWQEVSNPIYRNALSKTDSGRMAHIIKNSAQKGAYSCPISYDKKQWKLVEHGYRKFIDGANGICTDRHITWAELENIDEPSLHVIMTSRHQVPAAFSPSGKPRLVGSKLRQRLQMWERANDLDFSLMDALSKRGFPMVMMADQNRQKVSAYPDKIGGHRVIAVANALDWIHLVDGDKYTWSAGAKELRAIESDHKEIVLPVKLTPSSTVK